MTETDDDFGWFSPADFDVVLSAIAKHPNPQDIVLVGGQSLVGWAIHYKLELPHTDYPALTQDVDFLGGVKEAEFLAKEIGAACHVATLDDNTPNTAVLSWVSPTSGKKLTVDFLRTLIGLTTAEIRKLAVQIQFEGHQPVWILHPLLCLKSRFENLLRLRSKRSKNGVTQARVAVDVARCFIRSLLDMNDVEAEKLAIKAAQRIGELARSPAGVFVFNEYGIDVLSAVDSRLYVHHHEFAELDWKNQIRWAEKERSKDKKLRLAQQLRQLLPKHSRR